MSNCTKAFSAFMWRRAKLYENCFMETDLPLMLFFANNIDNNNNNNGGTSLSICNLPRKRYMWRFRTAEATKIFL